MEFVPRWIVHFTLTPCPQLLWFRVSESLYNINPVWNNPSGNYPSGNVKERASQQSVVRSCEQQMSQNTLSHFCGHAPTRGMDDSVAPFSISKGIVMLEEMALILSTHMALICIFNFSIRALSPSFGYTGYCMQIPIHINKLFTEDPQSLPFLW